MWPQGLEKAHRNTLSVPQKIRNPESFHAPSHDSPEETTVSKSNSPQEPSGPWAGLGCVTGAAAHPCQATSLQTERPQEVTASCTVEKFQAGATITGHPKCPCHLRSPTLIHFLQSAVLTCPKVWSPRKPSPHRPPGDHLPAPLCRA